MFMKSNEVIDIHKLEWADRFKYSYAIPSTPDEFLSQESVKFTLSGTIPLIYEDTKQQYNILRFANYKSQDILTNFRWFIRTGNNYFVLHSTSNMFIYNNTYNFKFHFYHGNQLTPAKYDQIVMHDNIQQILNLS